MNTHSAVLHALATWMLIILSACMPVEEKSDVGTREATPTNNASDDGPDASSSNNGSDGGATSNGTNNQDPNNKEIIDQNNIIPNTNNNTQGECLDENCGINNQRPGSRCATHRFYRVGADLLAQPTTTPESGAGALTSVVDLDGDGTGDRLYLSVDRWEAFDQEGQWTAGGQLPEPSLQHIVDDLDEDGAEEAVLSGHTAVTILHGVHGQAPVVVALSLPPGTSRVQRLVLVTGDVDENGLRDVVIVRSFDGDDLERITTLLQAPGSGWSVTPSGPEPDLPPRGTFVARLDDVNLDGWQDLVTIDILRPRAFAQSPGRVVVYRGLGDGRFQHALTGAVELILSGLGMTLDADLTNDGIPDLVSCSTHLCAVQAGLSPFGYAAPVHVFNSGHEGHGWNGSPLVMDLDHDGWTDLITLHDEVTLHRGSAEGLGGSQVLLRSFARTGGMFPVIDRQAQELVIATYDVAALCAPSCEIDGDCDGSSCVLGQCLECATSAECGDLYCIDGACLECAVDLHCRQNDGTCANGWCQP